MTVHAKGKAPHHYLPQSLRNTAHFLPEGKLLKTFMSQNISLVGAKHFPNGFHGFPVLHIFHLGIKKGGKKKGIPDESLIVPVCASTGCYLLLNRMGNLQPAFCRLRFVLIGNGIVIFPVNVADVLHKTKLCLIQIALQVKKLVLRISKILKANAMLIQKSFAVKPSPDIRKRAYGKETFEPEVLLFPVK